MNYPVILRVLSTLLMINGGFMLTAIPFSIYYAEGDLWPILYSGRISAAVGLLLRLVAPKARNTELKRKDGYLVVTFGWVGMSFLGSLPYILSGSIPDLASAFFETMSGFSTTGATVLTDIEAVPKGVLYWRSLTQWIGGMGIIVLAVAILPLLGIGGMQLFVAEAPGISPDKLQPRIKETAKRLWIIYLGLTVADFLLLWAGGMTFYDAVNHSFTSMASGGFSTKNASIAHFTNPFIHYVLIVFMFLAGTNFTMLYFGLHGDFRKVFRNEEFRLYLIFCLIAGVLIGIMIFDMGHGSFERSVRDSLFQVISIVTTTGYVVYDYTAWTPLITVLFFLFMFMGASAGSTAGGVKLVRHLLLIKTAILEFKRLIHPNAILPVRYNQRTVSGDITFNVMAFIMIYILIFCVGFLVVSAFGIDYVTAIGAVAATLGNVGPAIGDVGPVSNFGHLPGAVKWVLSFLMLLGRLELFTVMILFTPYFWRKV